MTLFRVNGAFGYDGLSSQRGDRFPGLYSIVQSRMPARVL